MRVAYFYEQKAPLPMDHPNNNPYGPLLAEALERPLPVLFASVAD